MADPLASSLGILTGVAVGTAAAAAVEPAVELPRQTAWAQNKVRVLDPAVMARLVATGGTDLGTAQTAGGVEGFNEDKVNALVYLAQTVPGFAEAMTIWRRQGARPNSWDAKFSHAMVKGGLDQQYETDVENLFDVWLTPAQIALAIVRSVMTDPGVLVRDLDTSGSNVPQYTPPALDTLTEAIGGGTNLERLKVLVASIGLPPSVQQLASMYFRAIITEGGYNQGIEQGDARPEWAPFWLEQAREILTARDYVELYLRGWITQTAMYAGTALHGMTAADTDLLYEVTGRPLAVHQITTGLARGGVFQPTADGIQDPYEASVHEANLRPEFYDLAIANKYTIPGYFVIKALLAAGTITQAEGEQYYLDLGWPPDLAAKAAAAEAVATTSTASPVKSATTTALTSLRKAYIGGQVTAATAPDYLTQLGIDTAVQPQLLAVWDVQKNVEALTTPTA